MFTCQEGGNHVFAEVELALCPYRHLRLRNWLLQYMLLVQVGHHVFPLTARPLVPLVESLPKERHLGQLRFGQIRLRHDYSPFFSAQILEWLDLPSPSDAGAIEPREWYCGKAPTSAQGVP